MAESMQERILGAVHEKIHEGVYPRKIFLGQKEASELFGRSWIFQGGEVTFKQWVGHPECMDVEITLTSEESEFKVE